MAADISATFASLSSTEGSNAPLGTTSVSTNLDDNIRMVGSLLAAFRDATGWGGLRLTSIAGTANAITGSVAAQGSITVAPTAYAAGMRFTFIPTASNTAATTINIGALGAKNIFLNGVALVGYELRINCPVEIYYDGTQFNIISGAHGGDGVPIGTVKPFAGSTAPNSYLFCYGQAVSRTTYADLFALLSTTYGVGDGATTFNLPDLRGRVVAGQDDMGGVSADRLTNQTGGLDGDTLGATGGTETHTLTTAQIPAHTHTFRLGDTSAGANFPMKSSNDNAGFTTDSTGGGGAHNNVQPTIILNYVIKT